MTPEAFFERYKQIPHHYSPVQRHQHTHGTNGDTDLAIWAELRGSDGSREAHDGLQRGWAQHSLVTIVVQGVLIVDVHHSTI